MGGAAAALLGNPKNGELRLPLNWPKLTRLRRFVTLRVKVKLKREPSAPEPKPPGPPGPPIPIPPKPPPPRPPPPKPPPPPRPPPPPPPPPATSPAPPAARPPAGPATTGAASATGGLTTSLVTFAAGAVLICPGLQAGAVAVAETEGLAQRSDDVEVARPLRDHAVRVKVGEELSQRFLIRPRARAVDALNNSPDEYGRSPGHTNHALNKQILRIKIRSQIGVAV